LSGLTTKYIPHPDESGTVNKSFTLTCNKSTGNPVSWWHSTSPDGANPTHISTDRTLLNGYAHRCRLDGDDLTFDKLELNDEGYYICLEDTGHGVRHITYLSVTGNFTPVL